MLYEVITITLKFGGVTAIKDISFDIRDGEIRAIIGPNGAGKSVITSYSIHYTKLYEGAARARGHHHGARRPRQDLAFGSHPPGQRGRTAGRDGNRNNFV